MCKLRAGSRDGLWLKNSTSSSQDTKKPHLFTLGLYPKIQPKWGAFKFLVSWNFWEYFLTNTAEYVASKTRPVCSELQIPRPAAVLKESRCTCFAAECIWDVPVYFWQDLLPGSASTNWDEILQHSESVFYSWTWLSQKKTTRSGWTLLLSASSSQGICLKIILEILTDFKAHSGPYICLMLFACGFSVLSWHKRVQVLQRYCVKGDGFCMPFREVCKV